MRSLTFDYSKKEQGMIEHFGYSDIAPMIAPFALYRLMVEKAFVDDDRSAWAESLRRCLKAFQGGPFRDTPEWDALIEGE